MKTVDVLKKDKILETVDSWLDLDEEILDCLHIATYSIDADTIRPHHLKQIEKRYDFPVIFIY